jgi:hydroxyacylglutathione hydrolase
MKTWKTQNGYQITQLLAGRSNVFLLTNGKLNLLVDTSPAYKWKKLTGRLRHLGVEKLDYLVLTHTHFDHAGNALKVKSLFNAKVIVHQNEAQILRDGTSIIPKGTNWLTKYAINPFGKRWAPATNFEPCEPDLLIDSVYRFNGIGLNAYLLPTPGHTVGSMCLIVNNEIAIVGDAMFGISPNSVFPPFADDTRELVRSWGKLLKTGCYTFLPSHGTANSSELLQKEYYRRIKKI